MSEDGMYIYFVGVIDYLQEYLWHKEGETKWKGHFDDIHKISSVPPKEYGERFFKFMEQNVIKNQLHPQYNYNSDLGNFEKTL